jgi:hypothetical protein
LGQLGIERNDKNYEGVSSLLYYLFKLALVAIQRFCFDVSIAG